MRNPCYDCYRPGTLTTDICSKCEVTQRKKQIADKLHIAEQVVHWLSYQSEMNGYEREQLKKMSNFLQDLREQIE